MSVEEIKRRNRELRRQWLERNPRTWQYTDLLPSFEDFTARQAARKRERTS